MSSFADSYKRVFDNEKGYWAGNSRGRACGKGSGETYNGIDRQCWPKWQGWEIIDKIPNKKHYQIFKNPLLQSQVVQFYKDYFKSLIVNAETINNQDLADFVLDFLFHRSYDAVKVINFVAKHISPQSPTTDTKITGHVISVINNHSSAFYITLRAARIDYYNNPKKYNGKQAKSSPAYTASFIERVNTFPKFIKPIEAKKKSSYVEELFDLDDYIKP